jgi:hypothetical protein
MSFFSFAPLTRLSPSLSPNVPHHDFHLSKKLHIVFLSPLSCSHLLSFLQNSYPLALLLTLQLPVSWFTPLI